VVETKRSWWLPVALVGVLAAGVGISRVAAWDPPSAPAALPCDQIMDPPPGAVGGAVDPLTEAGLRGALAPAALVRQFTPDGLTFLDKVVGSEAYVEAVFTELVDENGTVAIYLALHPKASGSVEQWQQYLADTFSESELDFYDNGHGSILGVVQGHPQAAEALAAYKETTETTPLWRTVAAAVSELGPSAH